MKCRHIGASSTGLCAEVVSALKPACSGPGAEVDSHPRDMLVIVSLLSPEGHGLRVVASSTGWEIKARGAAESERPNSGIDQSILNSCVPSQHKRPHFSRVMGTR